MVITQKKTHTENKLHKLYLPVTASVTHSILTDHFAIHGMFNENMQLCDRS